MSFLMSLNHKSMSQCIRVRINRLIWTFLAIISSCLEAFPSMLLPRSLHPCFSSYVTFRCISGEAASIFHILPLVGNPLFVRLLPFCPDNSAPAPSCFCQTASVLWVQVFLDSRLWWAALIFHTDGGEWKLVWADVWDWTWPKSDVLKKLSPFFSVWQFCRSVSGESSPPPQVESLC